MLNDISKRYVSFHIARKALYKFFSFFASCTGDSDIQLVLFKSLSHLAEVELEH